MLDSDGIGLKSPDADRTAALIIVILAIIMRDAPLDRRPVHVAQHNAAARVVPLAGDAEVVVGAAVTDVHVLVRPAARRVGKVAEGLDARVGIVVGRDVRDSHVFEAALGAILGVGAE